VAWNLGDLYRGLEDPAINGDLEAARRRAQTFESNYRGQINRAGGPSPDTLHRAVTELESLSEQMDKPAVYASLLHAAKTDDPARGALLTRVREQRAVINKHLIFFDLEWVQLSVGDARRVLAAPALAKYRHYLEHKRAWKPHYLSEPEEKVLDDKNITGRSAFMRLFDESVSAMQFPFEHDGKSEIMSMQQINAKLYDPDRTVRQAAAAGWTKGLK
jgi:oligoendopeptidase F